MKKEQIFSLLRTLLTLAGAYLFGKNFFGLPIDSSLWQEIVGIGLGIVSVVWSIIDKTIQNDVWQGVVRHLITFASGILVAKGIISAATVQTIIAAFAGVFPWLLANLSSAKNDKIASGELQASDFVKK
jgi:hypothetical protein